MPGMKERFSFYTSEELDLALSQKESKLLPDLVVILSSLHGFVSKLVLGLPGTEEMTGAYSMIQTYHGLVASGETDDLILEYRQSNFFDRFELSLSKVCATIEDEQERYGQALENLYQKLIVLSAMKNYRRRNPRGPEDLKWNLFLKNAARVVFEKNLQAEAASEELVLVFCNFVTEFFPHGNGMAYVQSSIQAAQLKESEIREDLSHYPTLEDIYEAARHTAAEYISNQVV